MRITKPSRSLSRHPHTQPIKYVAFSQAEAERLTLPQSSDKRQCDSMPCQPKSSVVVRRRLGSWAGYWVARTRVARTQRRAANVAAAATAVCSFADLRAFIQHVPPPNPNRERRDATGPIGRGGSGARDSPADIEERPPQRSSKL